MRWIWIDPDHHADVRAREELMTRIDAWWHQFQERADDLDAYFTRGARWDLPAWVNQNMPLDGELAWEFGPAIRGGKHRLAITPESSRWLRPIVNTMIERAPAVDGWEFYGHRMPDSVEWMRNSVRGRTGFELTDARVELSVNDHRIHLRFTMKGCGGPKDQKAQYAALVATESLLGEEVLDAWIGAIEAVAPERSFLGRAKMPGIDIAELRGAVDREIAQLRASLPKVACIDLPEDWQWSMWKRDAPRKGDCAAQDDLFVGKSALPPMWHAAHNRGFFDSRCFSNHGETFCYLKMDGSEWGGEEMFADKAEIEDALDAELRAARAGSFIGGGTGFCYSYVDLALNDVVRGAEIVRRVLQQGNLTRRSWILFFDSALAHEWIGIWPDSPPPPTDPVEA